VLNSPPSAPSRQREKGMFDQLGAILGFYAVLIFLAGALLSWWLL
jgi:cytochrome c biogenesis protein ResB